MWKGLVQSAVAVVAFAIGWILRSASTESLPSGAATSADLQRLTKSVDERLAEMSHRLDSLVAPASAPAAPVTPSDTADAKRSAEGASAATPEELLRRLDALAVRVEALQASLSIPKEVKEKDVDAVEATLQEYRADPVKGRRLQFGATRADLIRKYGMPDSTTRSGQTIEWFYFSRQSDDGIRFSIEDGVVQGAVGGPSHVPRPK
jgi:outer membrane protein assembly factor BamE (lipoprotein component of BamABCDE complex)